MRDKPLYGTGVLSAPAIHEGMRGHQPIFPHETSVLIVGPDKGDEVDESHQTKDDEFRHVKRYW